MPDMPMMSVVLVVRRHQAYVRECLRSILDQAAPDIEVVVVDDASTDHSAEILDEIASGDSRVLVHRPGERHGLGASRDIGLGLARGEHVWFVDAADYVRGDALARVAKALYADNPDVLLVEHVERDLFGEERAGSAARETPYILWNKVIRRSHLIGLDLRFGSHWFSEVGVTYPTLLTADRVHELSKAVYCRRQVPRAVSRQWQDGSPFDIFEQYDRVFAFVESLAVTGERDRTATATNMLRHYSSLLDELPAGERAEFFHRSSDSYRAHRGTVNPAVGVEQRLSLTAVQDGRYRAYQWLASAARHRRSFARRLHGAARRVRRDRVRAGSWRLRHYYAAQLRKPMDVNLAVFAAYWYGAYSCNPRAIYEKASELAPWIEGVWVVAAGSEHVVPRGVRYVVAETRDYYRTMARAKYFINNVNFPNDISKRPGQIHVQTHHGTPLKTMGMDLADAPFSRARMNFPRLLKRIARWDFSISANAFTTEIWERVYPSGTYESLETGYPRNDALANATVADAARLRLELGIEDGKQAVLYAPTHREFAKGFVPLVDVEQLARRLGPDFVILMRTHYFYAELSDVAAGASGRVIDVTSHPSIEALCIASDLLVTDYSSLMFDYAVLDRPIVIYAPDWPVYRAMRGVYFDLMAQPPGAVAVTEDELTDVLASRRAWDEDNTALRKAFRAKYCSLEDGRAAERVVRRLWPDQRGPAPS